MHLHQSQLQHAHPPILSTDTISVFITFAVPILTEIALANMVKLLEN